ncbi:hypothetical protein J6590_098815, partial [Homalodisca vitripennis]
MTSIIEVCSSKEESGGDLCHWSAISGSPNCVVGRGPPRHEPCKEESGDKAGGRSVPESNTLDLANCARFLCDVRV